MQNAEGVTPSAFLVSKLRGGRDSNAAKATSHDDSREITDRAPEATVRNSTNARPGHTSGPPSSPALGGSGADADLLASLAGLRAMIEDLREDNATLRAELASARRGAAPRRARPAAPREREDA